MNDGMPGRFKAALDSSNHPAAEAHQSTRCYRAAPYRNEKYWEALHEYAAFGFPSFHWPHMDPSCGFLRLSKQAGLLLPVGIK